MESPQVIQLRCQNQLLKSEVADLSFRLTTHQKERELFNKLAAGPDQTTRDRQTQLTEEINSLKRQNSQLNTQNIRLMHTNNELEEKVNDLKFTNCELKQISEKQAQIHQRELEMTRKERPGCDCISQVRIYEARMAKCQQIVHETEQYYATQAKAWSRELLDKNNQISSLRMEVETFRSQSGYESENKELMIEQALTEVREQYERKINQLNNRIRFLIVKIESMQDNGMKPTDITTMKINQNRSAHNSTAESSRFTPSSSNTSLSASQGNYQSHLVSQMDFGNSNITTLQSNCIPNSLQPSSVSPNHIFASHTTSINNMGSYLPQSQHTSHMSSEDTNRRKTVQTKTPNKISHRNSGNGAPMADRSNICL